MKGTWKKKEWLNSDINGFCVKSEIDGPLGSKICEKSHKYTSINIDFNLDDPSIKMDGRLRG